MGWQETKPAGYPTRQVHAPDGSAEDSGRYNDVIWKKTHADHADHAEPAEARDPVGSDWPDSSFEIGDSLVIRLNF